MVPPEVNTRHEFKSSIETDNCIVGISYPLLLTQNQIRTSSISYIVVFVVPFVLKQTTQVNMSFEKQKLKQFN